MDMVCLDLEGVLIPEVWVAFAEKTGIQDLKVTTREIPDYDRLMNKRLGHLHEHGLCLADIQEVIADLEPMQGAKTFLDDLRQAYQVVILSDTFYQFATPLIAKLGQPTLFCHKLIVSPEDRITGYQLRQQDPKRRSVEAFKQLNFRVLAAGDSYNDMTMLAAADVGILFRAPEQVKREFPAFQHTDDYATLRQYFDQASVNE